MGDHTILESFLGGLWPWLYSFPIGYLFQSGRREVEQLILRSWDWLTDMNSSNLSPLLFPDLYFTSSRFFFPSSISPSFSAIILSIWPRLTMIFSSSFNFCVYILLYLLVQESFLLERMVHIFTMPWYSLNCASSRYYSSLSQISSGMWRSGEGSEVLASCSVTLLYLSTIFMYFMEKTRSYSYSLPCYDRNQGQIGFYLVDNFLFISFYSSFSLRSSVFSSLILFQRSYFLEFRRDYSPSLSYSLLSLSFLTSLSSTRRMFSLFLMCSTTTLSGSAWFSCEEREMREYFCCSSYLSSLPYRFLRTSSTFLFYYCSYWVDNLLWLLYCRSQAICYSSYLFQSGLEDIGTYYKIIAGGGGGYQGGGTGRCGDCIEKIILLGWVSLS